MVSLCSCYKMVKFLISKAAWSARFKKSGATGTVPELPQAKRDR